MRLEIPNKLLARHDLLAVDKLVFGYLGTAWAGETVAEVSAILGLPQRTLYRSLAYLESKRLIVRHKILRKIRVRANAYKVREATA